MIYWKEKLKLDSGLEPGASTERQKEKGSCGGLKPQLRAPALLLRSLCTNCSTQIREQEPKPPSQLEICAVTQKLQR